MDILIRRATENDWKLIVDMGQVSVGDAHRASCSEADMNHYLSTHYNEAAIRKELSDPANIYYILFYNDQPAGFSKIVLNAPHPNVPHKNGTKLDRIYLLSQFHDLKLGHQLLHHNVALSKENGQCCMWLFTWTGNERAVRFYKRNGFTVIGDHMFKVSETHSNPNYHMLLAYDAQ
jgi:ribosomal protein S18 acetylase RimI-like enzyme